ncbi:MAG: MATE family efflux transporter [Clostridia bacterium]|nr:MATE family efflux transporter [Clostridia bacterium]
MTAINNVTNNPLGTENLGKLLSKFAIPSIIAMLISSLYNIVDQIFIGQGIGYLGNAATNVAFPLTTICLSIALLIGVGSAARFSICLGAKHYKEAVRYIGNAFWMTLILSIVCFVVVKLFTEPLILLFGGTENIMTLTTDYVSVTAYGIPFLIFTNVLSNLIRADGSPTYSMICTVLGAVINIILDPIFIFTFNMGISGAAWATVIAQFISFVFCFAYLFRFKLVKLDKEFFRPQLKVCLRIASLGASNAFTQLGFFLVQIILNNSLVYYGSQSIYGSEIPLSAFGVVMKINLIFVSVFVGIAQGAQPIIGFNYGAEYYNRVRKVYKLEAIATLAISLLSFILFQCFPHYIISMFGTGDEVYMEFAVKSMRIFLFMVIVNGLQIISSNFFSAIGKPLKGIILTLSRSIFFLIPAALILPLFLGVDGILYAGPIADALAFVVSIVLLYLAFKEMPKNKSVKGI